MLPGGKRLGGDFIGWRQSAARGMQGDLTKKDAGNEHHEAVTKDEKGTEPEG